MPSGLEDSSTEDIQDFLFLDGGMMGMTTLVTEQKQLLFQRRKTPPNLLMKRAFDMFVLNTFFVPSWPNDDPPSAASSIGDEIYISSIEFPQVDNN